MADKKVKDEKKANDEENKAPKTDRRDIAKRYNPFAWFREMERRMMDEFNNIGFGSWLGREGDFGADTDEIEDKEAFTKNPRGKNSGWSYHYQTGMDAPEISTRGDVKPEDIEKYLAEAGKGMPSLGPAGKNEKEGKDAKETEAPEDADAGEWNPFEMFSDIFRGFSEPFFTNMGKFFKSQTESQLGDVDASKMKPTAETPAVPEPEALTKAASEAAPQVEPTSKGGKAVVEPFAEVLYDKEGNLIGTLEIPGATEDTLKISVDGQTIRVEAEGLLRSYRKELQASFKPDPKKVTCRLSNGICELRAEKV